MNDSHPTRPVFSPLIFPLLILAAMLAAPASGAQVIPRDKAPAAAAKPADAVEKPTDSGEKPDAGKQATEPQEVAAKSDDKVKKGDGKQKEDPFGFRRPQIYDEGVMVVTASRVREDAFEIPRSMTVVGAERLRERSPVTITDALDDQIGVWVERRTSTTSDPVIRGLSGSNLSALIDGNTLSTFWGEGGFAGDDMYGKIDAESIERIEVLRGPGSVQYGSNALGGVLNFITRSSPIDYQDSGFRPGARAKVVYGSAADEFRSRLETFGASTDFKYLVGWSFRDIDDVEGGRGVGTLEPSSGKDCNLDGKVQYRTSADSELTVSGQAIHRRDLYRYYRPNQHNQNYRYGLNVEWSAEELTDFWDQFRANVYYQHKEDKRTWFNNGDHGKAEWVTWAGNVQAETLLDGGHRLVYGVSMNRTDGESPDDEQFTITQSDGTKIKPAPDSTWDNIGGFVMDRWQVTEQLALTGSIRYDWFRFDADPDRFYQPPGGQPASNDDFTDYQGSLTGGFGAVYALTDDVRVFGDWSRGFRQFAPNFGVRQLAYGVLTPNEFLDPVTADNFELGTRWRTNKWWGSAAGYYTNFDNFQNIVRGSYQGQDWYDYNNNSVRDPDEDTYVTEGDGNAYVYGVELEVGVRPGEFFPEHVGPQWSVTGGFMWNYGKDTSNHQPLRHTHPARMLFALRWDDTDVERGIWWEFAADFVRHYDRIPPGRQRSDPGYRKDPQDPTSGALRDDGLPGYSVFDLRGGMNVSEWATVTVAIENLTNKKYRTAHSRMDSPGTNVQLTLDVHFY